MTEYQHMIVGMALNIVFYYIFLRKYFLKQYREIKRLKNKIVSSNKPDIMSYDEFIAKKNIETK